MRAGNIYINRPNTGARVAIEPFGGFKMSGTGPKAGGTDYLKEFHFALPQGIIEEENVTWAKDSGYNIQTPRPSLISIAGRISRFENFSRAFLNQYELFMGTVNEKEKAQLSNFTSWIKENLRDYLTGTHANFTIPGQLSYNDKSLVKESGLFVTVSGRPTLKSMHYLFGALSLGCGLSIVCVTEEAYNTWKGILDIGWKAGFSKSNLDCVLMSPDRVQNILVDPSYSFVYAGQLSQHGKYLYKNMLEGKALQETMRLILSEVDGVSLHNSSQILDQFIWVRSMAINTMRHGAPLELNA